MSGAEQMVREVLERLGSNYETVLLTGRFDENLPFIEERKNFKIIRLGIGHKKIDKFLYPVLAAFKAQSIKPDIIHAIMESYAGAVLVILKYLYPQAKRILTLQSGDLYTSEKMDNFLFKFIMKTIHKSPHVITAISRFLKKCSVDLGTDPDKIKVIPNGADFSNIPSEVKSISNRVFFAGRLSREKGAYYMLQAWPLVLKEIPGAKLVQVGDGDMREEAFKIIKDLNIEDSVELKLTIPHDEYMKEFKKSEVVICPSLAEGLGIAFIEAQLCGRPIIGTNVGGIPEVIDDQKTGLLIEPKNSEQIAGALIKLLKDTDLRNKLVKNAKESVKRFDWNKIIKDIENIYEG
ncbi:hypothetical protein A2531_05175 [Candidatus Falkowbacteria bacterium RIFOXYD2_FULL_34_120]|uniref:Glycosyl transferase family 1 domain-containing protein n=1 Tax=Candidatus Falkowbacteria bacterium RIFOXYD2_FULL_34_120 TaxID=1798007 RepID=A0A1F5TME5_9BACT|nr:MAG: hypothetical protein A2500_02900 [Candidatus Falkowbacteria bacterium RIFOXYC12_FULL_34_55]OGF37965.1 MAG: hypothetical protein A2466_06185 [Candidatus Falkowbacteria bacterium RIFOXYC2_FULL_34_220]OGF39683.1 MAG: hypothetical protein A2515_07480 [Candidatus Falkowbacteria bacterium RIFOXYD12_FULL_34_57]OGF40122.1 MAG: hypothetical protein A2531_05175 [Candidatus Falkowbacteria bacterium RIFOXYD2_FULL_34_120]